MDFNSNEVKEISSHTFRFDPTFKVYRRKEFVEQQFFCETFSLIDSMRKVSILQDFVELVKAKEGAVTSNEIVYILENHKLVEASLPEEGTLQFLLDRIYGILNRIVLDGFVSCMHTSSLGCLAWEAGQLYLTKKDNSDEILEKVDEREKGRAWVELAQMLQDLAEYQRKNMKIHHNFQKRNYAEDPRTKNVYGSTILIIIFGMVFMILRNFKLVEAKEFMWLLTR